LFGLPAGGVGDDWLVGSCYATDLLEPIRLARNDLGLQLALLSPSEHPARSLRTNVDVLKTIRHGPLQASQLPDVLRDHRGEIHRPRAWRPV